MVDIARGDAALAWIGALGISIYLRYIHTRRSRSLLEQRMLLLLYCLLAFCIARGFWSLFPGRWVSAATLAPAVLLPLAATLFVEGMLRRHVSLPLKIMVASGSVVFSIWNLLPSGRDAVFFKPFTGYVLVSIAWLGWVMIRRDRKDLASMENRYADAASMAFLTATLCSLTELGLRPAWLPYGLGGLGALMFLHTCVHLTDHRMRRKSILVDLARYLLEGAAIAGIYALVVHTSDAQTILMVFLLSSSFVFIFGIRWRLRSLGRRRQDISLRRWLVDAEMGTLDAFIAALHHAPWGVQPLFLREDALTEYDHPTIGRYLAGRSGMATLGQLRTRLRSSSGDRGAAEQLVDLLESNDMTHVALLGEDPLTLLLVNLPDVAGVEAASAEIALVQKFARLLPNRTMSHA